jgi:MFS family permease
VPSELTSCIVQVTIDKPSFRAVIAKALSGLYFCVFYLGYDASLLNGLQAMDQWNDYFNEPSGNLLGLISSSLFLPAIITPYIAQWISDHFGRKMSLAIGSLLLILGAFINAFANSLGMFIAGRVLVGAAGPFGKTTVSIDHVYLLDLTDTSCTMLGCCSPP